VRSFNDTVAKLRSTDAGRTALHELHGDVASVHGMARFDHTSTMPWHADRPAIAVYRDIAADDRLPDDVRKAAGDAAGAVEALVLAHRESGDFGPWHQSYNDAAGPTVHLPTTKKSFDGWAEAGVTETHNGFFDAVDGREFARAIGSYNAREDAEGATV
jgi:hypothetical protein